MSLGGGMPRIPGGGRVPGMSGGGAPRMPRIRDPRMAARSQLSRNPLVRGWRKLTSNRFAKRIMPDRRNTKGANGPEGDAAAGTADLTTSTAVTPSGRSSTVTVADPLTHDPAAAPTGGPAAHHRPGPGATRSQRRSARRAARRAAPRVSRRQRRAQEGALWRSLMEVGRAQWGADFDERGLDGRFISAFDTQTRVLVSVPHPDGGRRRVVGSVEVAGFAPEGDAIVSFDPSEGRLAARPEFRIRSESLSEAVPVTDEMTIEGVQAANGRFHLLAGVSTGTPRVASDARGIQHQP